MTFGGLGLLCVEVCGTVAYTRAVSNPTGVALLLVTKNMFVIVYYVLFFEAKLHHPQEQLTCEIICLYSYKESLPADEF